jgi:hypothetical protein
MIWGVYLVKTSRILMAQKYYVVKSSYIDRWINIELSNTNNISYTCFLNSFFNLLKEQLINI